MSLLSILETRPDYLNDPLSIPVQWANPVTMIPGQHLPSSTQKRRPVLEPNPNFVFQVKKDYKVSDTILIMCRSGGRSALAVNLLAEAGFKKVYNIIDGFEGDAVKDPQSYYYGKRVKNGWRNSGAPWTYKIEPNLMYQP